MGPNCWLAATRLTTELGQTGPSVLTNWSILMVISIDHVVNKHVRHCDTASAVVMTPCVGSSRLTVI